MLRASGSLDWLWGVDWKTVFIPDTPLLEIFVRGTITYFVIYMLLRFVLKRQTSGVEITDVLVIVLIADAAQNAMAGEYKSITDGVLLVAVIIVWAAVMAMLGWRFPAVGRILHAKPLPLIRDGEMLHKNMAREFVTDDELMSQLRMQGIEEVGEVERAFMEPDGQISIIKRKKGGEARRKRGRTF
ncbi:DUF421 domain-containing protein [Microbacterium sp. STN6]|uniref:DUF421 domain-containing protein n=1 Tax=Microbacterium sp. STN6 TaxID=2995588 RepID=UPI002260E4DC|nr:YetF domain-containing protein [Microbacterium sp. STN6]MCX7522212.1 DUF421 domain-containing protein [Microbacterium sp. STN6]